MPHKDIIQKSLSFRKIKDIEIAQFTTDVEKHPLINSEGHTVLEHIHWPHISNHIN